MTNGDFDEVQRRLIPAAITFEQLARDEDWNLVSGHFARSAHPEPVPNDRGPVAKDEDAG